MSEKAEQISNFDLDAQIKIARELLNEENVPLTKLASFVEEFANGLSQKYPKMMEIAMSAGATQAGPASAAAEVQEEPTSFDVIITGIGADKINVIKEVRAISGLGLKESKDIVDKAIAEGKSVMKSGADKKEAESIKAKLEAVGAKVSLVGV